MVEITVNLTRASNLTWAGISPSMGLPHPALKTDFAV
jgi:hypothetical protein